MGFKTHYDNLKVSRTATQDEIKKSYRRLCSKHHPDKYPEQERERQNKILVIINKAYTVLSNDNLRKQHDEWIRQQKRSGYNAQQEAFQREQKAREEQKRKEEELKKQKEEELRKAQEEKIKQKIREDILAQQELRKQQELQAAKEAAIKKAKECKEDKERKLINIITGVICLAVVTGIVLKLVADTQTKTPIKPTYTYDVSMKIIKITKDIVNDKLVTDVYFDNHRDDVTIEQLKDLLKGSLSDEDDCYVRIEDQHRIKYQYVFHFVRGGKRIYLTAPLDHLCKKD